MTDWVSMFGEFEVSTDEIVFKGKQVEYAATQQPNGSAKASPETGPAVGTILSPERLSDGRISARVTFQGSVEKVGCDLILAYEVETGGFLSAGIPHFDWPMFAIREWVQTPTTSYGIGPAEAPHWNTHASGGDRTNLRPDHAYMIEVALLGTRVTLYIDGVHVASANLPSRAAQPRQVGLWCASASSIQITDFTVDSKKPQAFVVMQFSEPYDQVYKDVIREICQDYDVMAARADEVYGPGVIIADVVQQITAAQLVIADITPTNANVFFEVGYALALNKPIILLAKKGTQLPFDVAAFRVLFYEDSIGGKSKLEEGLRKHLKAILGGGLPR